MLARILVIEDNVADMELMVYLLHAYGHTTYSACDGERGVEIARCQVPDLVLCDIRLPKMDGFEVARRLRGDPDLIGVPLVAVTAMAMVGDRDTVLAAGFMGYISKPIVPESFVKSVESFLHPNLRGGAPLPSPPSAPAIAMPGASHREKILMVDDRETNIMVVADLLEPFGYTVLQATSIESALITARSQLPDLIITDLYLSGEYGSDLVSAIKQDDDLKAIPVVILTASAARDCQDAAKANYGADLFLQRPIESHHLLAEIESLLWKPRAASETQAMPAGQHT